MNSDGVSRQQFEELQARLQEAEQTLQAIRSGEVDAIVVQDESGDRVYTLKNAEQPYRALVEQMLEAALILTSNGDILYANRRFSDMVGIPLEAIIGGSIARFISDRDREALAVIAARRSGTHQGHLITASRERLAAFFSQTTNFSEGAEHRNLIVTDLSELQQAQDSRDRAERENRSKDDFLAMLGHELRNPLAAISSGIALLESGPPAERRAWVDQMIARQTKQLQRLVDDLLDVARISHGKIGLRKERVLLQKSLEASIAAVEDLMAQRRHELSLLAPPEEIHLEADPARLEQMVVNLLTNAAKFTPEGGRVWLSAELEGNEVVIRCRDTGLGLSPENLDAVFDSFVQFNCSADRAERGIGLGLSLVRKLAELHGGSVTASSGGEGKGSEFILRLPGNAADAPGPAMVPATTAAAQRVSRRILLVDDNRDLAEGLALFLRDAGHEVVLAHDGQMAIAVATQQRPDIVLLDIGLPDMDGFAVAEQLRASPDFDRAVIIAMSGWKLRKDNKAARVRFDAEFVKPVNSGQLIELLAAMSYPGDAKAAVANAE